MSISTISSEYGAAHKDSRVQYNLIVPSCFLLKNSTAKLAIQIYKEIDLIIMENKIFSKKIFGL